METIPIRVAFTPVLLSLLTTMGIGTRMIPDDGHGPLLEVLLDDEKDERLLALWDQLTDLRVRFIEANQWHQLPLFE